MKWINFLSIACFAALLASCTSTTSKTAVTDSAVQPKPSIQDKANTNQPEVLVTAEDGFIKTRQRNETFLFGKQVTCKPGNMVAGIQKELPDILRLIKNAQAVIVGPMTMVYDQIPAASGATHFFVGIPVKSKFTPLDGSSFRTLNGGTYYEMICNAQTGSSAPFHEKMTKLMQERGLKYGLPAIEIASESRNNEMTVVSKSVLMYPMNK